MSEASDKARVSSYLRAFTDGDRLLDLPVDFLFDDRLHLDVADVVLSELVDPRPEHQRRLLYLCGFFPEGAAPDVLARLLLPEEQTLDELRPTLDALLAANLLQVSDDLLFAPTLISEHAGRSLPDEARVELERRHARTCLLSGAFEPISCLQIVLPREERARIEGQREAFEQAISRTKAHNPVLAAELFLELAHASFTHGRSEDLEFLEGELPELLKALEANPTDDARILLFHLHIARGELAFRGSGKSTEMFQALERAKAVFPSLEAMPTHQQLTYYYQRAITGAFSQRDLAPYIEAGERALALARSPELPPFVEPQLLRMMARLISHEPPRQEALEYAQESMRLSGERELSHLHPICQLSCGLIHLRDHDNDAALPLVEGLPAIFREQENPRLYQASQILLALLHYSSGELARALSLCNESWTHLEKHEDVHFERLALQLSALLELELGRPERALEQQRKLGWLLDPHTIEAHAISGVWLFGVGAMVYHCAGDFFGARRMWLDVEHYKARFASEHPPEAIHHLLAFIYEVLGKQTDEDTPTPFSSRAQREEFERLAALVEHDISGHDIAYLFKNGIARFIRKRYFDAASGKPTLTVDALPPTRFQVNREEVVDIQRRAAIRRILTALIDEHGANKTPESISLDEVFSLGWPGEQGTPESISARVYNTISRMRRMGLEEILVHDGDGYHLARDFEICVEAI